MSSPYITRINKETACPHCWAQPGEKCTSQTPHSQRLQAAPFKVDDCYPVKK